MRIELISIRRKCVEGVPPPLQIIIQKVAYCVPIFAEAYENNNF
ncbi:MAG: hypothetical protein ACXVB4_16425 [Pseudobdellovibrionaceae bacterium]